MPERLVLGAGMHGFSEAALQRLRQAVLDADSWVKLGVAVAVVKTEQPGVEVGAETYQRVPNGRPADHPRASLLRHSSLYAAVDHQPLPAEVFTARLLELGMRRYERLAPRHQWLVELRPD